MKLRLSFGHFTRFAILLLTILNVYWTLRLLQPAANEHKSNIVNNKTAPPLKAISISEYFNCPPQNIAGESAPTTAASVVSLAFDNLNFEISRWDNQRLYKLYDFALVGDDFENASVNNLVCLATQSSVERLHSLAQVARQWSGPISVAVYVAGDEEFFILQYYVTYMRLCFPFVRNNVSIHIAMPKDKKPTHKIRLGGITDKFDCQFPEQTLHRLLKLRSADTMRWRLKNEYPQNHMRNLARKGCQNKYVFLTDVDIIPSGNIVPLLNKFLLTATCHNRCAYVIPTFEIDIRAKFPSSKTELLRLVKKGLARPFHEKVFIYNQYATNFSSWLANTRPSSEVVVSHIVTNFEFLYEPFYVAVDTVPAHDERFIGYGFTRNSQVYEMYIAGYAFYVLSPIFTCHWGLQQKKSRPAWREQQNNMNRKRFEKFKSEIFARYKNDPLRMFASKNRGKKT